MTTVLVMLVGVAVTLAACGAVFLMTNSIAQMHGSLVRGLAIAAALCLGVLLLVTSVYISVKLAVAVGARPQDDPPKTARIDVGYMQSQLKDRK
ncbi:MAG: hypothetical protein ACRD5W_17815 [Candidatus Acidiferrales bacterium]